MYYIADIHTVHVHVYATDITSIYMYMHIHVHGMYCHCVEEVYIFYNKKTHAGNRALHVNTPDCHRS